jgi:hypothetical protein
VKSEKWKVGALANSIVLVLVLVLERLLAPRIWNDPDESFPRDYLRKIPNPEIKFSSTRTSPSTRTMAPEEQLLW